MFHIITCSQCFKRKTCLVIIPHSYFDQIPVYFELRRRTGAHPRRLLRRWLRGRPLRMGCAQLFGPRTGAGSETLRSRGKHFFGKFSAKFHSFSAVSAPIFARKYAFCSIFQNLSDYQAEIFKIWQNLSLNLADFATFAKFC